MKTLRTAAALLTAMLILQTPALAGWMDSDRALLTKGKTDYQTGQMDQAVRDFTAAIQANPNNSEAHYWRGLVLNALKQQDQALADFDEAIRLGSSPDYFVARGLIYSNQGQMDRAIADFDSALQLDPMSREARTNKEFCLREMTRKTQIAQATSAFTGAQTSGTADSSTTTGGISGVTTTGAIYGNSKEDRAIQAKLLKQRSELQKQLKMQQSDQLKLKEQQMAREREAAERLAKQNAKLEQELAEAKRRQAEQRVEVVQRVMSNQKAAARTNSEAADPGSPSMTQQLASLPIAAATISSVNRPIRDKWALVIGISNFQNSQLNLKYPAKDAKDFCTFLTSSGNFAKDHVKLLTDSQATRDNILAMLGDKWLPHVANPDDLVVIYISSHGSSDDIDSSSTNYLIAYDTDVKRLISTGLPMQDLTRLVKRSVHSDRVVMILDACHSGATQAESKGMKRAGNIDANEVALGSGQLVISSSSPNQVSWESTKTPNSVFTEYLMEGLKTKGDKTTLEEAFKYMKDRVQSEVLRDRGVLQTPVLSSAWKGNDVIIGVHPSSPGPGLDVDLTPPSEPIARPDSGSKTASSQDSKVSQTSTQNRSSSNKPKQQQPAAKKTAAH
jgi:tetratricopeptide (TPR) repeat protein